MTDHHNSYAGLPSRSAFKASRRSKGNAKVIQSSRRIQHKRAFLRVREISSEETFWTISGQPHQVRGVIAEAPDHILQLTFSLKM